MLDLLKFDITARDRSAPAFGKIKGELRGIQGALTSVNDRAMRAGRSMRNIGAGMSLAITAPMLMAAKGALSLYDTQVQAEAKVATAIASTGGAAGRTAAQLKGLAGALQNATTFGDEDILANVTAPLLTFTKVQGAVFDRAQASVLDMAELLKMDLKSAAILVGKALNDPIKGVSALSRSGVQFTDQQKNVIKALVKTGEVAKAQAIILRELETQFKGQAAAAAATPLGRLAQLQNSIGDLREDLGREIAPFLKPLVDNVREAVAWFALLSPEVKKNIVVIGGIAAVIGPAVAAFGLLVLGVGALVSPLGIVTLLVGAGAAGFSLWAAGARDSGTAAYDAEKGSRALNAALGVFYTTAAPSAGKAAIDLANDNYKLAHSARAAAIAQVEAMQTAIAAQRAKNPRPEDRVAAAEIALAAQRAKNAGSKGRVPSFGKMKEQWADEDLQFAQTELENAKRAMENLQSAHTELEKAKAAILKADADRKRAATAVTGSDFKKKVTIDIAGVTDATDTISAAMQALMDKTNATSKSVGGIGDAAKKSKAEAKAALDAIKDRADRLKSAADGVNEAFGSTFSSILRQADSVGSALSRLLDGWSNQALSSAGSWLAGKAGLGGILGPILANADGNAFSGGRVTPFATGGVVSGPTTFPMNGGTGLMGEAGPEAIMPLTRMSGGKLGVRAAGGGGSASVSLNFAPVIDARGADQAQVDRIHAQLARMAAEFDMRVQDALRKGRNSRLNLAWQS